LRDLEASEGRALGHRAASEGRTLWVSKAQTAQYNWRHDGESDASRRRALVSETETKL
jgi:hypothetical protein